MKEEIKKKKRLKIHLEKKEKKYIRKILDKYRWNRGDTAGWLGISRVNLYQKMVKFGFIIPNKDIVNGDYVPCRLTKSTETNGSDTNETANCSDSE